MIERDHHHSLQSVFFNMNSSVECKPKEEKLLLHVVHGTVEAYVYSHNYTVRLTQSQIKV